MRRIRRPSHATVVAYLALFLALGGGTTAIALSGKNTVQSNDLGPGAQVKAPDVADDAVNGADVADNSLRNTDLGVRVRGARQPATGPARICGTTADWEECVTVFFTVPRPQRLLLVGSGEWFGLKGNWNNFGECRFSVGNLARLGHREFGESSATPANPSNIAMNTVTGVLKKGQYEIGIDCRDTNPNGGDVSVLDTELSVVALGDG